MRREIIQPNGNEASVEFGTLGKEERSHLLMVIQKKNVKKIDRNY
jgi:hypothetical protein